MKKIKLKTNVSYRPVVYAMKIAAEFIAITYDKPRTLIDAYHYRQGAITLLKDAQIPHKYHISPEEIYELTIKALSKKSYSKTFNAFFICMTEAQQDEMIHFLKHSDET